MGAAALRHSFWGARSKYGTVLLNLQRTAASEPTDQGLVFERRWAAGWRRHSMAFFFGRTRFCATALLVCLRFRAVVTLGYRFYDSSFKLPGYRASTTSAYLKVRSRACTWLCVRTPSGSESLGICRVRGSEEILHEWGSDWLCSHGCEISSHALQHAGCTSMSGTTLLSVQWPCAAEGARQCAL